MSGSPWPPTTVTSSVWFAVVSIRLQKRYVGALRFDDSYRTAASAEGARRNRHARAERMTETGRAKASRPGSGR